MTTTTDTTSTTDTNDNPTEEPQPVVADETTTDDTEGTQTPDSGSEDDSDVAEDQDGEDADGDGPGREAAKYRRRLRDTEVERDRLAERVESLQRAEVERQAAADSLRPAALWSSGFELADLLTDDGTVSAAKVSAAIKASREKLGIPAPPVGPRVPGEGRSVRRPPKPSGKEAMVNAVMGRSAFDD